MLCQPRFRHQRIECLLPLAPPCGQFGQRTANSITLTAFTAGDQTKMDRSFPSCTTEHVHQQRQNVSFRDGLQRSNRVWICCCSVMKSWLIMFFYTKFALVRSYDWWVSFTRPWAVFTRLGRPDEWLVRTLNADPIRWRIYVALGGDELMTQFTSYDSRSSENLWMTMNCI